VVKALTAKALDWAKSLPPSPTRDKAAATKKPQPENPPRVETVWTGPNGGDWSEAANWNNGLPGPDKMARIPAKNGTQVQVKSPATVQAIEISGQGRVELGGESITLGNGAGGSMNSILVAGGEVTINNNLINTQNKRITLGEKAQSLTLKGSIETGGQPTLIGNLGQGALTIHGDRSGGNALVIRDGIVTAFGILSNTGGGVTQVLDKGVLVSSRKQGPTIQQGSLGLALREKGVFRLGAPNQIASFLNFAGGKLEMGGFSNDQPVIGNAALNANSVIDFSNPEAESLTIGDVSKNTNWKAGATLHIIGFSMGDSLRFGENPQGLTKVQLAAIKFDGKPAQIDEAGYVSPAH
jgi:hypothetical protein